MRRFRRPRRAAGRPRGERIRRRIHLLPNLFTLGNLFAGFYSVSMVLAGDLDRAAIAIGAGIVFDGLDGAVARLVRSSSPVGVQLDSLADVVTFGLAPALLAFAWGAADVVTGEYAGDVRRLAWIASFAYLAACALRLARFNVMTAEPPAAHLPSGTFIGMPTPTAAAIVAIVVHVTKEPLVDGGWAVAWVALVFVVAGLMISRMPFPSPKRWIANPPSPHLTLLAVAALLAATWWYSEIVLAALLLAYGVVVVVFNLRVRGAGGAGRV